MRRPLAVIVSEEASRRLKRVPAAEVGFDLNPSPVPCINFLGVATRPHNF